METPVMKNNRTCFAAMIALGVTTTALGQVHTETMKILPDDGAELDLFGWALDIDNGLIAVGSRSHQHKGNTNRNGGAYIFDLATGTQLHELLNDNPTSRDSFGWSIAMSDGMVGVGSPLRTNEVFYLFDAFTGLQIISLSHENSEGSSFLGESIAIDNGLIAIGAGNSTINGVNEIGAAYIFDAATGLQTHRLLPDDLQNTVRFGNSIDIQNNTVVVGSPKENTNQGAVYLFDATTGAKLHRFQRNNPTNQEQFGSAVAIDGNYVLVGAPNLRHNRLGMGAAYLFDRTTGQQIRRILPSNRAANDTFGQHVAMHNGLIAISSRNSQNPGGSVYLFDINGNQIGELTRSDVVDFSNVDMSLCIAIENRLIAVGSSAFSPNGENSGAVYIYDLSCDTDLTNDGDLNFLDISAFLAAYSSQDPIADFEPDGNFNFLDVSKFLAAFAAGCP